jgi:hypothetical protein
VYRDGTTRKQHLYGGVVGKLVAENGNPWTDEYVYKGNQIPAHLMRNNDLMVILMNEDTKEWAVKNGIEGNYTKGSPWWRVKRDINGNISNGNGRPAPALANRGNSRNPKKHKYLQPKESGAKATTPGNYEADRDHYPGLSGNRIYRDPFRNEFVISVDIDRDGYCEDQLYSSPAAISPQPLGLVKHPDGHNSVKGREVMIWTNGPDMLVDPTSDLSSGVNGDNLRSWE